MSVLHKNLTGADLHEPKGADAASGGMAYKSDGAGSGSWRSANLGSFAGLKIVTADGGTAPVVTAVAVSVINSDGGSQILTDLSVTMNFTGTGAGKLDTGSIASATWYHLWAIAKEDGTKSVIGSTSSTAPTLPTGYTYKFRIGAVRTKSGSAVLRGSIQYGRKAQFTAPWQSVLFSGVSGSTSTPTWTSGAWGSYAPPTAGALHIAAQVKGANNVVLMVAPNNSYGAIGSSTPPPIFWDGNTSPNATSIGIGLSDWIIPESTNIYYACSHYTGTNTSQVTIMGWEDNL